MQKEWELFRIPTIRIKAKCGEFRRYDLSIISGMLSKMMSNH